MIGGQKKLSNKSSVDGFPSNYRGRKTVMSLTGLSKVPSYCATLVNDTQCKVCMMFENDVLHEVPLNTRSHARAVHPVSQNPP